MPTYQYRCTECGRDLEVVQKFSDASLTECPTCSGKLRKVFNAVGVVFKGSGFYRTDSRAAADGAKIGADKKSESSGDKSGDKVAAASTEKSGGDKAGSSSGDSKPSTTESSKPAKVPAGAGGSSSTGSKAAAR